MHPTRSRHGGCMRLRFGGHDARLVAWPTRAGNAPRLRDAGVLEAELRRFAEQDGGEERLAELLADASAKGRGGEGDGGDAVARVMQALGDGRIAIAPVEWRMRPKLLA